MLNDFLIIKWKWILQVINAYIIHEFFILHMQWRHLSHYIQKILV